MSPLIVFFISFNYFGFLIASLLLAITTFITIIISIAINDRLPYFAIFSGVITILTSLLSYILKIPDILIIEDSVFNFLFFISLFYSSIKKKLALKKLFGHIFLIKDSAWKTLQARWQIFFLISFLSNEYVRIFYSPEAWVEFRKYFLIVFLIFGNYQFTLSAKERLPGSDKLGLNKKI